MTQLASLLPSVWRADRVTHVEQLPVREARTCDWPAWAGPGVIDAFAAHGIVSPWAHQVATAEHAWAGRHVVVATGTASGKSVGYLLPALTALSSGRPGREPTVLYIAPTKALAADQLRLLAGMDLPGLRATTLDGDSPAEERDWARAHGTYLLTNPDMLHRSVLPRHQRWVSFLRRLRFVVVDECHVYRGVFGSHVSHVLRRLRRLARSYGSDPVFVLASATSADPAESAARLLGDPVVAVSEDSSPHGGGEFVLWEPPLSVIRGEHGAPIRRSATAETATLLADLVASKVRTLAFVRSRRAAEMVALLARDGVDRAVPGLGTAVAAYRGGYLPYERRDLEAALHRGDLIGVAATNALELGVDISGLDAVLLAGWPGTRASLWQQAGRAGRARQPALVVFVARDDPLDTYVVHHPEAIFGRSVEATVLDPDNPYVLAPHLCAAAQERALTAEDLADFGPAAAEVADSLVQRRLLRRRSGGLYWTQRDRASDLADLRGTGGPPVRLVEIGTGRLIGTVDAASAPMTIHEGAAYVHQGESYRVDELDLDDTVALVKAWVPDHTTHAREVSDVRIRSESRATTWGDARLAFGAVQVTSQVVGYLKRALGSGEILGEVALDLPERTLQTKAVWWTVSERQLAAAQLDPADVPGAAHAAEHASIGLLPLFATCDRWDIGGLSTAWHPDTGLATVFVHDGHPGGAGFAERGFAAAEAWLQATREAIAACECATGCPSCVQSPKCGNGNEPLDKNGAVRLLDVLLAGRPGAGQA